MALSTLRVIACLAVVASAAGAEAGTIDGTVFADLDGDGVFSAGDQPVEGAAVYWESVVSIETDAAGTYSLTVPGGGIVWVSVPDGYRPGPVWKLEDTGGDVTLDLPLLPVDPAAATRTFVVASDTHAGLDMVSENDIAVGFSQLVDLTPAPAFYAITGDITQNNKPEQFAEILRATSDIEVPFVPIPGNHDWYDGGAEYRRVFGPSSYSFNAGGVHYLVINDANSVGARAAFVKLDLSYVTDARPVVAFTHGPPPDELVVEMEQAGVDHLFTGHLHSNRILVHDVLVEHNTQALAMGGIDTTPAGFKVVELGDDDTLSIVHRTTVEQPFVELVYPRPGDRIEPCELDLVASVEVGAGTPTVTASVGDESVVLARTGAGWTYTGRLTTVCDNGIYDLSLEVETAGGQMHSRSAKVCVAGPSSGVFSVGEWPQLQGGAEHRGATELELAPPLHTLWAAAVDGNLHGGSPVVSGGLVLVPIADFGDGSHGGVVALDALTGAETWRYLAGAGVRSAPAVDAGVVVMAGVDGLVHAVSLDTGALRWTYQVSETAEPMSRSVYASPTIAGGVVFVGNQREFAALSLETGESQWTLAPGMKGFFGSYVTPVVADGMVFATFAMGGVGLHAWDTDSGALAWRTPGITSGMMASPLVDSDTVYLVDWETRMTALDRLTGEERWSRKLSEEGFAWGYGATATPALSGDTLLVPTHHGELYAIDRRSGTELWRLEAGQGQIRASHYQGSAAAAYAASPVVTGGLVWVGGVDGVLRAVDRESGAIAWAVDLGAPITMGAAVAGDVLYVATYDGTVRALLPAEKLELSDAAAGVECPLTDPMVPPGRPAPGDGCGCQSTDGARGFTVLALLLGFCLLPFGRRRRI